MTTKRNIPYLDDGHTYDLYQSSDNPSDVLIVFIHGGAWRSGDKSEHTTLAENLVKLSNYDVAVMNYRLSPRELSSPEPVRHPAHANDVHVALEHLLQAYRPKEMYLIGHSCGAHIIGTILQDSPIGTPFIHPSPELLDVIKGVVTAEGIYDLDLLLEDFPTEYYTTFIRGAFGEVQLPLEYNSYKAFSLMDKRLKNPKVKWKVVHSPADTLVNIRQAEQYSKSLERLNDLTDVSLDQSLRFEHDELLDSSDFAKMVVDFIHKPYLP